MSDPFIPAFEMRSDDSAGRFPAYPFGGVQQYRRAERDVMDDGRSFVSPNARCTGGDNVDVAHAMKFVVRPDPLASAPSLQGRPRNNEEAVFVGGFHDIVADFCVHRHDASTRLSEASDGPGHENCSSKCGPRDDPPDVRVSEEMILRDGRPPWPLGWDRVGTTALQQGTMTVSALGGSVSNLSSDATQDDCTHLSSAVHISRLNVASPVRARLVMPDSTLRESLALKCQGRGCVVTIDQTVDSKLLAREAPEVLVLDISSDTHRLDEVCAAWGSHPEMALVVIVGEVDSGLVVRALANGADDCVAVERGAAEISARIHACGRRSQVRRSRPEETVYRFSGWIASRLTPIVRAPDGTICRLSALEHALLLAFLKAPNRVLGFAELNEGLGAWAAPQPAGIDWRIRVFRLRRRLLQAHSGAPLFRAVRGRGYMIVADVKTV